MMRRAGVGCKPMLGSTSFSEPGVKVVKQSVYAVDDKHCLWFLKNRRIGMGATCTIADRIQHIDDSCYRLQHSVNVLNARLPTNQPRVPRA